ncbi:MAG TPA: HPr kinase/phosphatase C-terminal domain-containing protein [Magnetospirillaceae bacterium]|jgi:serine kinase of HPr protein (carbohydrate metabolism regulator)
MSDTATQLIHASCIAINGVGVLLRGPSGTGKSDLALRLIDDGAVLVADDQVELARHDDGLVARPPEALAGLLEVRGQGIIRLHNLPDAPVQLVVDLVAPGQIERMPEPATIELLGCDLPLLLLDPFTASATAKLRLAVRVAGGSIMRAR